VDAVLYARNELGLCRTSKAILVNDIGGNEQLLT
jgi:hypothetical protein